MSARPFLAAAALAAGLLPAATACKPDFDERESLVDRPMVLAMKIEPPEAKPGEAVTATLLVATPEGPREAPAASFAFCATPKLLTENGSVSAACQADGVTPIASAPDARGAITAALPADTCFTFGPETSGPDLRPRDPDVTGGFYQPIRARTDGLVAFGFARIACNLANASADVTARFRAEYRANRAPVLLPLEARLDGAPAVWSAIPRGARVTLRATWRPEDAEIYALFDRDAQAVVSRRESMRVSWFTTAGSFESDRTGRGEAEPESYAENTWTAPDEARAVHLFAVLRDARGGVAYASVTAATR